MTVVLQNADTSMDFTPSAERVHAVWHNWPLERIPYRLDGLITEFSDVDGFEHKLRSLDAFAGSTGVPMSHIANFGEVLFVLRELFEVSTAATAIPEAVADLHRQVKALGKAGRRNRKRRNIGRILQWVRQPIGQRRVPAVQQPPHLEVVGPAEVGIPAPDTRRPNLAVEVHDGGRLLGTIRHEAGQLLALGPRGKRIGTYGSEFSARRAILASTAFNIIDNDCERQRRARLRKQPWKRRRSK